MPGITGIISAAEGRRDQLSRMTRCLVHEPFYVSGTCDFDAVNLSVGWTRLFPNLLPLLCRFGMKLSISA